MPTEVLVPPVGTNVDVVTLSCWYRQEGDTVTKGEPLFAVETDKATLDVEAPESGVLSALAAAPGDEVAALSRIAVIGAVEAEAPAAQAATAAAPADVPGPPAGPAPGLSPVPAVPRPRVFISPRARRLAEAEGLAWQDVAGTGPEGAVVERDVREALAQVPASRASASTGARRAATPMARRVAEASGIDLGTVAGSGPAGKVTRDDVARALPSPAAEDEVLETMPMAGIRALTAERMAASASSAAAVTLTTEADATALVQLRSQLAADGVAVSYNDLLLVVLARALREHPRLNASLDGQSIRVWKRIDLGLAIDTPRGLVVPVVRGVDGLRLTEIAAETSRLVTAAREGRLTPEEMRRGTFTLTNLGMFRIDAFTPIINLPECAILGVGRIKPQLALVDGQVAERSRMWLSLTFDHRLVDGGPAARFLQRVAGLVERPHLLLA